MTLDLTTLDAHEQPSDQLRAIWKGYSKTENAVLLSSGEIDDLAVPEKAAEFQKAGSISADSIRAAFSRLAGDDPSIPQVERDVDVLYHPLLPGESRKLDQEKTCLISNQVSGLLIVPSLLPPSIQQTLLSRLIHRDLSQPHHQTNLHLHYDLPYPEGDAVTNAPRSFFTHPPESEISFVPKDPSVHKPLSMKQVMERRLHWVTLGGQYDWTNRVYPGEQPPSFPEDVAGLLETLFPETLAQAAIVNFYTPGDTMMMHRDVSEETDKGLVSLSMGCDALFSMSSNRACSYPYATTHLDQAISL